MQHNISRDGLQPVLLAEGALESAPRGSTLERVNDMQSWGFRTKDQHLNLLLFGIIFFQKLSLKTSQPIVTVTRT